jgi:hypothetical protein
MDVRSLYTNIPHEEGIQIVTEHYRHTLEKTNTNNNNHTPAHIYPDELAQIMRYILTKNSFQFNEDYYIQTHGTAMGAKFAVKYANIYVYTIVSRMLSTWMGSTPSHLVRYIDDIFFIWNTSENELLEFHAHMNKEHPTIKFDLEYSTEKIPFLDTMVYKEDNKLKLDLYRKPTDKQQYLHKQSSHPKNTKHSIIYSQALRYKRIITDPTRLKQRTQELTDAFIHRGYKETEIKAIIEKTENTQREDILYKQPTQKQPRPACILQYHPSLEHIGKSIRTYWEKYILSSPILAPIFPNYPVVAFKKNKSIRDHLVHSSLIKIKNPDANNKIVPTPDDTHDIVGTLQQCNNSNCITCKQYMNTADKFTSYVTGKDYKINTQMSCNTTNIIYLIECKQCSSQYIGETSQTLSKRLTQHIHAIRHQTDTRISWHFNQPRHSMKDITIRPIERIFTDNKKLRLNREHYWIKELKTIHPFGINKKA